MCTLGVGLYSMLAQFHFFASTVTQPHQNSNYSTVPKSPTTRRSSPYTTHSARHAFRHLVLVGAIPTKEQCCSDDWLPHLAHCEQSTVRKVRENRLHQDTETTVPISGFRGRCGGITKGMRLPYMDCIRGHVDSSSAEGVSTMDIG